jgi:Na+-driven multidrug efflux pump
MLLFTRDPAVIAAGVVYLHIAALITWAYASLFTSVSVLQGLKKPAYPVWIGLYRQIVGPLLIYSLGTRFFGVLGLWWGIFGVTWSATLITLWYTRRTLGTT